MNKLFLIFITLFIFEAHGALSDKKVLVLNSYHPQYEWTFELNMTLKKQLETRFYPENIYVEFMDSRKFSESKVFEEKIYSFLKYKYSNRFQPEIIISTDDYAFQFLLKYGEELFPNVPVVFGGVNVFNYSMVKGRNNFTGVLEGMEITKNLELININHPKLKTLYVLADQTNFSKLMLNKAIPIIEKHAINYEVLDNLTFKQLKQRLNLSTTNNAALLLAIHHDVNGRYFSYKKDLKEVSNVSKIPIYGMWGINNGNGTIGGYMTDAKTHANEVFKSVEKLMEGFAPSSIAIKEKTQFVPQFDYNVMKKFELYYTPTNSDIINLPSSFYRDNFILINAIIVLIFILVFSNFFLRHIIQEKTKRIREVNQRLNEFVGIVAHDIRNPIGSIIGIADVIISEPRDNLEHVPLIKKSAENTLKMVNDLLDLSAIEAGKVDVKMTEIDLKSLFFNVVHEVQHLIDNKNIELNIDLPSDTMAFGDFHRLDQVLQNLLTNSIKFTHSNGRIELLAIDKGNQIIIKIKDNGIGMPKDLMKRLFDKNEHVSRQGTNGEKGTGYGLPLVYELVKCHKSKLSVNSLEGVGTTFSFALNKVNQYPTHMLEDRTKVDGLAS